ncbi:zinc finger protein 16-like isoform X2 [Centropristis striata]|uniref:zinc finger protein 16-like isoform X2 n=1 Tax=Centropristis striata TaxID=184440 RepID=UPI0027DFC088|nr:zinc finger protein 16-like isoform X2 [Centropristis striata]
MDAGVFESQTRAAVELSVRAAAAALQQDWTAGGGGAAAATCPRILQDMGRDLTEKISQLHRDSSSELLRENRTMRAEVGRLEAELKSNITAAFQLEKQLRSQVGRLRRGLALLDRDLRRVRGEQTRELLQGEPNRGILQSRTAAASGPQCQARSFRPVIVSRQRHVVWRINNSISTENIADIKAMHITVREGRSLPEIRRCSTCCDDFHCPFCSSTFFKPTSLSKVKRHLETHFNRAVFHGGYTIHRCGLGCRPQWHYHCPHCQSTLSRRADFTKHLVVCKKKPKPAPTSIKLLQQAPSQLQHPPAPSLVVLPRQNEGPETEAAVLNLQLSGCAGSEWGERSLSGPVQVLLQTGSVLGTPAVSLCSSQTVADPAALSLAVLTGQTSAQPSAPLIVTSQPRPDLTSVPVSLSLTAEEDARRAADSQPASASEENKPVDSSVNHSQPQETVTKLCEDKPEDAGEKSADQIREENRRRREKQQQKRVFCEKCNKGFHYRHQLKQHMSCHDKPFSCHLCDKRFHKEQTLQTHLLAHKVKTEKEKKMWPCSQCDAQFRLQKNLKEHLLHHEPDKSFKCSVCEKTYSKMHLLKRHEAVHARVRPFVCDICGKGFTTKSVLQEHQSIHTGEKPFTCTTCGKSFRTSAHLFSHKRVHSEERPFRCSDCGKTFKLKRALVQHRVVHTGEKPFVCQMCGIRFGLKNNLRRHLRVHKDETPFRCEECKKEFPGSWAFKTHMLVHGAKKRFMCGKTLLNSKLLEHQESHAEENNFICATCGKTFHRKCTFVYHMRRHGEERLDSCSVCGKRFLQLSRLRDHMTLHTGEKRYTCEQCGKAFRTRNNFHRHTKLHRGERPFECQVCSSKFSQSNQLKSHMQIHTGVKLYSCHTCSRGFSDSRQLKRHSCGDGSQKPMLDTGNSRTLT